jgi:hypothetical protein
MFGLVGAGLGAAIGSASSRERWKEVPIPSEPPANSP